MKTIIILGASGDLSKRKLIPDLSKVTNTDFKVVCYARSELKTVFKEKLKEFYDYSDTFLNRVEYISGDYETLAGLEPYFDPKNIFYLSIPPKLYKITIHSLVKHGAKTIVMEKPFGRTLEEFLEIKNIVKDVNLYLVDHYLYKPMSVAIKNILSWDESLQKIIAKNKIKSCEIIFKEFIGVEGRKYFDESGMVKDVVENHLAVIIALIFSKKAAERVNLLRSLKVEKMDDVVFGQYEGYKKELEVESRTETICLVPMRIDNDEWRDMPIVVFAAKGMDEKKCEARLEINETAFKEILNSLKIDSSLQKISKIEIVFNFSPRNEIFVEIMTENGKLEHVLYDSNYVNRLMKEKNDDFVDHQIVFNSLLNDIDIDFVGLDEAASLLSAFIPIVDHSGKELFEYEKGSKVPDFIERITENLKTKK